MVIYMQHVSEELLFFIFKKLRMYFFTFSVLLLSTLRANYHKVPFVFFRIFFKEWLLTSTVYIKQPQIIIWFPFSFCWGEQRKLPFLQTFREITSNWIWFQKLSLWTLTKCQLYSKSNRKDATINSITLTLNRSGVDV